jgi:hypothetical protein
MCWSIEVFDGAFPATLWQDAHGRFLIEAALTRRGLDWWWHRHDWGVVSEVEFDDEDAWEAFRHLPAVQAALDAVPDPVQGLLIYPGRGGSSGRVAPRGTSPTSGAGAAALPLPPEDIFPGRAPDALHQRRPRLHLSQPGGPDSWASVLVRRAPAGAPAKPRSVRRAASWPLG